MALVDIQVNIRITKNTAIGTGKTVKEITDTTIVDTVDESVVAQYITAMTPKVS